MPLSGKGAPLVQGEGFRQEKKNKMCKSLGDSIRAKAFLLKKAAGPIALEQPTVFLTQQGASLQKAWAAKMP